MILLLFLFLGGKLNGFDHGIFQEKGVNNPFLVINPFSFGLYCTANDSK